MLNVGVTVLKRKCRQYNIPRWPYRKLKSIQNLYESMESLEAQQGENGIDADNIRETKLKLFVERESMLWDPAISLNHETKKLRQSNFKYEYKVRQDRHSCSGTDSEADQLVRGAMAGEALSALPGGPAAALGTELAAWPQPLRTLSSESDASLRGQVAAYDEAQSSGGLPAKLPHPTL